MKSSDAAASPELGDASHEDNDIVRVGSVPITDGR